MKTGKTVMDTDSPLLDEAWFAKARPAHEVLPERVLSAARRAPGRPAGSHKTATTIRFDDDVLAAFRAAGPGWQTRMNDALREWLKSQASANDHA